MAAEKLVIIQSVSKDGKSFVINHGSSDNLTVGVEALFTNKGSSYAARVVKVSKYHSAWKILEDRARVPFQKDEFVTYTQSIENIWLEMPKVIYDKSKLGFVKKSSYIFRFNNTLSISESISQTESSRFIRRNGLQAELAYNKEFMPHFSYSLGARIDREVSHLERPIISIPSTRILATVSMEYHLDKIKKSDNNFFFTLGSAMGWSISKINKQNASGIVIILPNISVGLQIPLREVDAILIEAGVETIIAKEKLPSNTQKTHVTNAKLIIGYKF